MREIDPASKVIIDYSAKAGSASVLEMFYAHTGDLDSKPADVFVHDHKAAVRERHGIRGPEILEIMTDPERRPEWTVIKFVRNPFDRAVSGFTWLVTHPRPERVWPPFADVAPSPRDLTFRRFLQRVEELPNEERNIHFRPQRNPYEDRVTYDAVVQVEHLEDRIEELNERFGTRFRLVPQDERRHRSSRAATDTRKVPDVAWHTLEQEGWPRYAGFYDEPLLEVGRRIYASDLEAYGYEPYPSGWVDQA